MGDPVSLSILAAGGAAAGIGQAVAGYKAEKDTIALQKDTIARQSAEDTELFSLRGQDRMAEYLTKVGKVSSYAAMGNIAGGGTVQSLQASAALATAMDAYVDTRALNTTRRTSEIQLAALDRDLKRAKTQLGLSIMGSVFGAGSQITKSGVAGKAQASADESIAGSPQYTSYLDGE